MHDRSLSGPRPWGLACGLVQGMTQDPPVRPAQQPDQFDEGVRACCTGLGEHLGHLTSQEPCLGAGPVSYTHLTLPTNREV